MHVNRHETGRWDSNPGTVPPSAATSADAAIGRFSSPNALSEITENYPVLTGACALDVPCDRDHSTRDWFGGIAFAVALFFLAAGVAGWLAP